MRSSFHDQFLNMVLSDRCTCSAIFPDSAALNVHLKENENARLKGRQLICELQQHLEECLSHSKAEDGDVLEATGGSNTYQDASLRKHKDRDGFRCPRENCNVKPVDKLPAFRAHYGTRMIAPQVLVEKR